jgi:hypothetical protein
MRNGAHPELETLSVDSDDQSLVSTPAHAG